MHQQADFKEQNKNIKKNQKLLITFNPPPKKKNIIKLINIDTQRYKQTWSYL